MYFIIILLFLKFRTENIKLKSLKSCLISFLLYFIELFQLEPIFNYY